MLLLPEIRNLILDMDGVLWLGNTPIPGLVRFFETLHRLDIKYALATNNATITPEMYVKKLSGFGVSIPADRIITSAVATASYLSRNYPAGTRLYAVGGVGLHLALAQQGFELLSDQQDGVEPAAVVVALDKEITYERLSQATLFVARGARFIGTNPDPSYPSERGELPGAGALQAVISTATGIHPLNVGKPGPIMFEEALRRLGGSPSDSAMVGDRLSTDIVGARQVGLCTVLVMSGVTDRATLAKTDQPPDYVFASISELGAALAAAALVGNQE